jgi:membrane protease YdiL (CAAX protease family)
MDLLALLLLLATYLGFASSHVVSGLRRFSNNRARGSLLIASLLVPYLLATLPSIATDAYKFLAGLAGMAAYLFVPGLALLLRPRQNRSPDLLDLVAILALWFPVEFGWLPNATLTLGGTNLPLAMLTAICLGFLLFLVIRPLSGIGYTFKLSRYDAQWALLGLGGFALVGLPLSIAMGFIQLGFAPFDAWDWLLGLLAMYFFTALPEELLFRGIIQNLIECRFGRNWATLAVGAVIFGLSHINNSTAFHSPPNWPYVFMATLAGLAYGWVWRKSGKITASALTHTLVNFIWGIVFQS